MTTSPVDEEHKSIVTLPQVVIRFAGDSGDGMQLTGDRFTAETAGLGNDIPEAEILIHDAHAVDPAVAFALSRLSDQQTLTDTPIGVFRDVQPPSYDRLASEQNEKAVAEQTKDLRSLLRSSDTWTVN
ncbi:MAG: hypothetical protein ACYYNF_03510 [Actinomycetes bacterium]